MKLTRRLCDRCRLPLSGSKGHGFVLADGRLVHGRCPDQPEPIPPDEAAAIRKVSANWWGR